MQAYEIAKQIAGKNLSNRHVRFMKAVQLFLLT